MTETDLQYYERRMALERELSATAACPEAASVHRALAVIYAEEVRRLSVANMSLGIVRAAGMR